jgi:hypothetical protein
MNIMYRPLSAAFTNIRWSSTLSHLPQSTSSRITAGTEVKEVISEAHASVGRNCLNGSAPSNIPTMKYSPTELVNTCTKELGVICTCAREPNSNY